MIRLHQIEITPLDPFWVYNWQCNFARLWYIELCLTSFCDVDLCVEYWWMGKTEDQILAATSREDSISAVRYACTVSSGSDTVLGGARNSAFHFWGN
jgi:hypothetical protein